MPRKSKTLHFIFCGPFLLDSNRATRTLISPFLVSSVTVILPRSAERSGSTIIKEDKFVNTTTKTALLILATCWAAPGTAAEWHYEGPHGVEHWGEQFATCAEGVNQSPVDITEMLSAELAPLHIDYQGQVSELVNNGHTIRANVSGQNTLTIEGETFTLKQFHFHTPSENTIQHKHYPLEAHFVHANPQGKLAVIAAMFESGPRGNPALETLLTRLPQNGDRITLSDTLNPASLLPREREYYRFNGSLTTPPCTEGVRWYVMKEPQASTPAQTSALQEIMGNNARPVQPLNARVVLQ